MKTILDIKIKLNKTMRDQIEKKKLKNKINQEKKQ